jgi:hypothetical protein
MDQDTLRSSLREAVRETVTEVLQTHIPHPPHSSR